MSSWDDDADSNADMWATAEESPGYVDRLRAVAEQSR
jgi:hypothetical protein